VVIGYFTFELHLPASRSLKGKRQVLQSLKGRFRSRHNVAVTEPAEHGDLWQRASLAVVSIAEQRDPLERLFEALRRDTESQIPGHLVDAAAEYIEPDEPDLAARLGHGE
jgi:uncharacterized protein YlxP (DUF503 family)